MNDKQQYIVSELWILSWNASVQRANLYAPNSELSRSAFRSEIIAYADEQLIPQYRSPVSSKAHERNILRLSKYGTAIGSGILQAAGYKVGIAQKLLNLQLKYLWCCGSIGEPPHCPIDRIMINKTPLKNQVNWTAMVGIDEYRRVIRALENEASRIDKSLAQWELEVYNRTDL
jgi:hypothetical protein